jgi:hypothetical protein
VNDGRPSSQHWSAIETIGDGVAGWRCGEDRWVFLRAFKRKRRGILMMMDIHDIQLLLL